MTDAGRDRPVEILLIEDNPGDVRLTLEALQEGRLRNRVTVARDGEEALACLLREGKYAVAARPDLILLDLDLPRLGGQGVLAAIRADPDLHQIPVVILTTSEDQQDIVRSYDLYANCYITKPVDLGQFLAAVRAIEDFWLTVVQPPPG